MISADFVPAYIIGTVTMKITGSDGKVKAALHHLSMIMPQIISSVQIMMTHINAG